MQGFNQIPSLTDLQQYNVNRADAVEAVYGNLYDTLTTAALGQTQLQFFQTPKGQNGKTLADTNMTVAGQLPAPQSFLVMSIELYFVPGDAVSIHGAAAANAYVQDVLSFYTGKAWLELFIGSKAYVDESPLMKFPPRCGLGGFAALSDATTPAAAGATQIGYAQASGPIYELNPPILLVPNQNFNVTLNWPVAIPLTVAGAVTVNMSGILYRNSQ